jgi:hypothetical protein
MFFNLCYTQDYHLVKVVAVSASFGFTLDVVMYIHLCALAHAPTRYVSKEILGHRSLERGVKPTT